MAVLCVCLPFVGFGGFWLKLFSEKAASLRASLNWAVYDRLVKVFVCCELGYSQGGVF